jgi:hypothetical protein
MTKNQSYLFESGSNSMTNQFLRRGMRAVVVNSDGKVFDVKEWDQSETFRLGTQGKLLVQDNQTRGYHKLTLNEKLVYQKMTWGNSESKDSVFIPYTFGINFFLQ